MSFNAVSTLDFIAILSKPGDQCTFPLQAEITASTKVRGTAHMHVDLREHMAHKHERDVS